MLISLVSFFFTYDYSLSIREKFARETFCSLLFGISLLAEARANELVAMRAGIFLLIHQRLLMSCLRRMRVSKQEEKAAAQQKTTFRMRDECELRETGQLVVTRVFGLRVSPSRLQLQCIAS